MAHVVETGAGLSNANAYLSAADADTYFEDYPNDLWTGDAEDVKEPALRRASQYLDNVYGERWKGTQGSQTQALDWPRYGVETRDGYCLASDALPAELTQACAELAVRIIVAGDDLQDDVSEPGDIQSEDVQVGPVKSAITYMGGKSQVPWLPKIDRLVAPLVVSGAELIRG